MSWFGKIKETVQSKFDPRVPDESQVTKGAYSRDKILIAIDEKRTLQEREEAMASVYVFNEMSKNMNAIAKDSSLPLSIRLIAISKANRYIDKGIFNCLKDEPDFVKESVRLLDFYWFGKGNKDVPLDTKIAIFRGKMKSLKENKHLEGELTKNEIFEENLELRREYIDAVVSQEYEMRYDSVYKTFIEDRLGMDFSNKEMSVAKKICTGESAICVLEYGGELPAELVKTAIGYIYKENLGKDVTMPVFMDIMFNEKIVIEDRVDMIRLVEDRAFLGLIAYNKDERIPGELKAAAMGKCGVESSVLRKLSVCGEREKKVSGEMEFVGGLGI